MTSIAASDEYLQAYIEGYHLYQQSNSLSHHQAPQYPPFGSFYEVESAGLRVNPTKDLQRMLAGAGISVSELQYMTIKPRSSIDTEPAYLNWFDGRNGVIVAVDNDKSRDHNPNNQRLWPSEIIWQNWAAVAQLHNSRVSHLRAVAKHFVDNQSTQRVIWEASQHSSCTREGPERGHVEYTTQDQGFYALLGSVNGKSSMRLLLGHKSHIGYRTVERVVVVGGDTVLIDGPEVRTFVILLSDRRTPSFIPIPAGSTLLERSL